MDSEFLIKRRAARFWSKVDQSGGPAACWPWTKAVFQATGYGQTTDVVGGVAPVTAPRQAWLLTHGDPGSYINPNTGKETTRRVLHRCPGGSNRLCCNPAHLALGSDQDNCDDRESEGRQARGEKMGTAKLTDASVVEIRAKYAAGVTITALAAEYDVARGTIRPCVQGKTWTHV